MKNNSFQNGGRSFGSTPHGVLPKLPGNTGGNGNNMSGMRGHRETATGTVPAAGTESPAVKKVGTDAGVSPCKETFKGELSFTRDELIKGFKMGIILGQPLSRTRMQGGRRNRR